MGKGGKVPAIGRGEQGRAVGRLAEHTPSATQPKFAVRCFFHLVGGNIITGSVGQPDAAVYLKCSLFVCQQVHLVAVGSCYP